MRPRVKGVVKKPGPGPAQYSAPQGSAGKAFSMTPRRQSGKGDSIVYTTKECDMIVWYGLAKNLDWSLYLVEMQTENISPCTL